MISLLLWVWECKLLFIMRLTFSICLFCILQSFAIGTFSQNQRLSINQKNISIENVMRMIEDKTDYYFMYSALTVDVKQKVDMQATNKSVTEILDDLFKDTDITWKINGRLIALSVNGESPAVSQQPRNISGKVTDTSGAPLPGVTLVIKGTSQGTITDSDGSYTLTNVPDDATLVFSFVGMKAQEVAVNGKVNINIALTEETIGIEEVVAIGYGTQSKRNVTGSLSRVDVKKMESLPNTNIAQALRGRVAGVQFTENGRPGQGGSILIRGQRSISASNNPLIVLDGIIFEGSINDINPGDIDAMDVLKDASATAIYGSRAANGVILITSKKGTTEKPTIRVNSYYGVSDWSYKPKLLTPERYIQKTLDWRSQAGLEADPANVANYLTQTEAKNYLAGNTIDPWEVASQNSSIQYYDVSISGRSNKTNYYISGNYTDEKGLIYNDNADRKSIRINFDTQITDWLKFGINSQYAERDMSGIEADVFVARMTSPFNDVWADEAKTDPKPLGNEDGLVGSILMNALINKNQEIQRNLFSNFYAVVDLPLKGLSFRINYSPNYRWYNLNNFSPIYQRNGLNRKGSASRQTDFNKTWVLENILTYTRQFAENHHIDVTLMYGRNQIYNESLTGTGSDFTGASDANGWNNLSLAKIQTSSSSASKVDAISSMARLNYRFKERYLLTLTGRRDGNSVFGANNKFGLFPSAAVAWIASEESFLKSVPSINLLKLRMSYGSVGNQAISAYQSLTKQGQDQYVFGDGGSTSTGLYPLNLANPDLGWETTTSTNFAVDFECFKGKIGGTVEYYNLDTKDLLLTRKLPEPTGFSDILTNVGATNNKGFEFTLNTINLQRGKFNWNSTIIFSTNKNKIVHLYYSDVNKDGIEDDDTGNNWFIGQPISVAFDYELDGVYQVDDEIPAGQKAGFFKMKDYNKDTKIDANDRHVLGTLQPKYRWSFTNNFSYGPFSLMFSINALQGWLGNNNMLRLDNALPNGNYPMRAANFLDAGWWTPENRSNTRPSLVYTNPFGHYMYQHRDFIRIQEFYLSYDFPKRIINRFNINSLKVYLSGRNLYTFTDWQAMDPENGSYEVPTPRTISFGLNVSL